MKKRIAKNSKTIQSSNAESLRSIAGNVGLERKQAVDELKNKYVNSAGVTNLFLKTLIDQQAATVENWIEQPAAMLEDIVELIVKADSILREPLRFKRASGDLASDIDEAYVCIRAFSCLEPTVPLNGIWLFQLGGLLLDFSREKISADDALKRSNSLMERHKADFIATGIWAKLSPKYKDRRPRRTSEQTSTRKISPKTQALKKSIVKLEILALQNSDESKSYPVRFSIRRHLASKGITANNSLLKELKEEILSEQLNSLKS